ncbi:MAG: 30S ribosomal protein S13, partial [Actinomycetota bacterium]|nr:30S ribosomal protein S13 [Actinomycetota bacterium]
MARISGIDIPREKRIEVSLTYLYGVGRSKAQLICDQTNISRETRVRDLTDEEVAKIRTFIEDN